MQAHGIFAMDSEQRQFDLFRDEVKKYCEKIGCQDLTFTNKELKQLEWYQTSPIVSPESQGKEHFDPLHFEIKRAIARLFSFELMLQGGHEAYQRFVKDQPEQDRLGEDDFNRLAAEAKALNEDVKTVVRLSCLFTISKKAREIVTQHGVMTDDSEEFLTEVAGGIIKEEINKNEFPITSDLTTTQIGLLIKIYWPKMHLRGMIQTEGPDNITARFNEGIAAGAFSAADFTAWKWRWYVNSFGFQLGSGAKYYDKNIHLLTQMVIVELQKSFEQSGYSYLDGYLAERARLAEIESEDQPTDRAILLQEKYFLGHLAAFSNKVHVIDIHSGLSLVKGYVNYQTENQSDDLARRYHTWRKNENAVTPTYVTSVYSNAYALIYKQHIDEGAEPKFACEYALQESTHFICFVLSKLYEYPCELKISLRDFANGLEPALRAWRENHKSLELQLHLQSNGQYQFLPRVVGQALENATDEEKPRCGMQ